MLSKNKLHAFIVIIGFSIGTAFFLASSVYIKYEKTYDNFIPDINNIYRVNSKIIASDGQSKVTPLSAQALAPLMKEEFPEIKTYAQLSPRKFSEIEYGTTSYHEDVYAADQAFLDIFDLKFTKGTKTEALTDPYTIIISESIAKKYFGEVDPIGKTLKFKWGQNDFDHTVTGVFEDMPNNSHLDLNILISLTNWINNLNPNDKWGWNYFYSYVVLNSNAKKESLEQKLPELIKNNNQNLDNTDKTEYVLFPVNDIHLGSDLVREIKQGGDRKALIVLNIVCLLIIIMSCFNFINMNYIKLIGRTKELELRKSIGADNLTIIKQIIFDFSFIAFLSVVVGLIVSFPTLSVINWYYNVELNYHYLIAISNLSKLGIILLGIIFIGSIYPLILFFTNRERGIIIDSKFMHRARLVLIVLQLFVVLFITFSMITIYEQNKYMFNKDLGFSKKNVMVIVTPNLPQGTNTKDLAELLYDNFSKIEGVKTASNMLNIPGRYYVNEKKYKLLNTDDTFIGYGVYSDYRYLDVLDIKLLSGRFFSKDFADKESVVINRTMMKKFGFVEPSDAVDKFLLCENKKYHIIGVIEDNHQNHLRNEIMPFAIYLQYKFNTFELVKLNDNFNSKTINSIGKGFREILKTNAFDYYFLNDFFNKEYSNDIKFKKMLFLFTAILILITFLGLWSVFSYLIMIREKEICTRKVLGASIGNNFYSLTKSYIWILIISLISLPFANHILKEWLNTFAYHISVQFWFFILPVFAIIMILLLVMIYHILKVVLINPSKILRYE